MSTLDLTTIPYLFPVRPGHRETLESFTRRVQARNHETAQHRSDCVRAIIADQPDLSEPEAWLVALEARMGRTLHLQTDVETVSHADGTDCADCATRIGARYLCRLCAHGASVERAPHLDNFVCLRHRMYVGPGTTPTTQSPATDGEIYAELRLRKLRRQRRFDSSLYTTLHAVLEKSLRRSASVAPGRRELFVPLVALAAKLTETSFRDSFFSNRASFSDSFQTLTSAVENLGVDRAELMRDGLWLRYRPVFLAHRERVESGLGYVPDSSHELPGPLEAKGDDLPSHVVERFAAYLEVGNLSDIDHNSWPAILTPSTRAMPSWTQSVDTICVAGHRTVRTVQGLHKNAKLGKDACGVCNRRIIRVGLNDFPTTHPRIAASFHPTKNKKKASEYFAGSSLEVWWRCRDGHEWQATLTNRTSAGAGCPRCSFSSIVTGQNDLATAHPDVAMRWDPANPQNLATISPRSTANVAWQCKYGHHYREQISEAVDRGTCSVCDRENVQSSDRSLAVLLPGIAAQLHPTRNEGVDLHAVPATSRAQLWWTCSKGHPFVSRVDHRVAGLACTVCFPRRLHPGVNDAQTRYPELMVEWHPFLNGNHTPDRVIPGNTLYWWRCSVGHNLQQSVPHRVLSRGCADCAQS